MFGVALLLNGERLCMCVRASLGGVYCMFTVVLTVLAIGVQEVRNRCSITENNLSLTLPGAQTDFDTGCL